MTWQNNGDDETLAIALTFGCNDVKRDDIVSAIYSAHQEMGLESQHGDGVH